MPELPESADRTLPHFVWFMLRMMLRREKEAIGEPHTGRELRHTPTRRTRDGAFLDHIAGAGLIDVAEEVPGDASERGPVQFRRRYRITELGRHAAEYGEATFTRAQLAELSKV